VNAAPMPGYTVVTESDTATQEIGRALAHHVSPCDVVILSGDLGAGKTQLTKGLAAGLGVEEAVTSPTFNILLVHDGRMPLYHFDLYRLELADQLDDIDYWETLEAGGVSVVEWGDRFAEAVPGQCVVVRIHITGDEERRLEIEPHGARGSALAHAWASTCDALDGVTVTAGDDEE
jgi:tRNA threonylcarbamoyladenosine biosynthesis protein TsaE